MNSNYHTAETFPQTAHRLLRRRNLQASSWGRTAASSTSARPVLTGNASALRALRAAEMDAWEAVPPSTKPAPGSSPTKSLRQIVRAQTPEGLDRETFLIFVLAAAGLIGLLIAFQDTSSLLASWAQFLKGIRQLLA